jgi:hypothetical protein
MNLPRAVAHHQNWVFTHVGGEEVTWLRDLAFMAQKEPTAGEDPLRLLRVYLRLNKGCGG